MKKISLLLAVVMLMSCVFSLSSCKETRPGKEENSGKNEELETVSGSKSDTDYSADAQKFGNMSAEEITFGNYNGEDIVWIVLEKGNSGTLLLSKYVLDYQSFDMPDEPCKSWMTTRLVKWLNVDFYDAAFTEEEQDKILWTEVEIHDMDYAYNEGDELYRDPVLNQVFLLGMDDLVKYYPAKLDTLYCEATDYAVSQGAPKENCSWWLRGPCEITRFENGEVETGKPVANVNCNPQDGKADLIFDDPKEGIRPAMWVDLDGTVQFTIAPSDWIAEVSCETEVTADGKHSYTIYTGTEYEETFVLDTNIDDYIHSGHFDLPHLLLDKGWKLVDRDGNPVKYTDDTKVSGAYIVFNDIETHFDFTGISGNQLLMFSLEYKVPGSSYFDTEDYYRNDPDIRGNYEHYMPLVSFMDHDIEYIVDGFGYDGWGELSEGLSYSDIVIVTYAVEYASKAENSGKNPFYVTGMKGSESLWYSLVYDMP